MELVMAVTVGRTRASENKARNKLNAKKLNFCNLIKFFRILLLIPHMPNVPRRNMWRSSYKDNYGVAADLGRTGMGISRFERIL